MRMLGFSCLGLSVFLAACSSNVSVFEEGGGGQGGAPQTTSGPGQTGQTNSTGQTSGPSTGTSGPSTGTSGTSTGTSGPATGTSGPGSTTNGQAVSVSATTSTGMSCENNFDCGSCIDCSIATECAAEYNGCVNDMECFAFNQCIQDCQNFPDPDACINECVETYPGGYQLYLEAVMCIYCNSCFVSCDGQSIGC
jgi:hypothetical protein